jgi:putative ATPase
MAKMVYAGEDPRFIFRRMAILAGEDVGMADPNAAVVVASCWELFERIGMPEGRFPLTQAALYLATCPKSNSALAFFDALSAVEQEQEPDVPVHLKDGNRDQEGFGHGKGYLYPHAYREHWVAQQYLPAALQGKVFYEPTNIGYEQTISEQVARRREAQLAAMVETEAGTSELFTTSPANQARDAWMQRTIDSSGRNLGKLRDRLMDLAQIQRHHLVLDLKAGSGLLTWEALRRAPEGGVWALAEELVAGEALRQQSERLPELERPVILLGHLGEFETLLELRGESEIRFDRIIGRNAFSRLPERIKYIPQLYERLRSGGRLCLAQVIPQEGQRLYRLVDWSNTSKHLANQVMTAEEDIYHEPTDPLVNWNVDDIAAALKEIGFISVDVYLDRQEGQRRITRDQLDDWFDLEKDSSVKSYGQRLASAGLGVQDISSVEALFKRQLEGKIVPWRNTVAYISGRC